MFKIDSGMRLYQRFCLVSSHQNLTKKNPMALNSSEKRLLENIETYHTCRPSVLHLFFLQGKLYW